jgi:nucleoside-triphosphatase THEP1
MNQKNADTSLNTAAEPRTSERLPRVVLISGPLHSGKTTLAGIVSERLRKQGYPVGGILAPGSWKNSVRNGFDLTMLHTGRTIILAERQSTPSQDSPDTGPFRFDESALADGRAALHPDICGDARVIFIDEIGKLELKGLGWASCLQPLLELPDKLHIWIVRETLVERVCSTWNIHPLLVVDATESTAEKTLMDIVWRTL